VEIPSSGTWDLFKSCARALEHLPNNPYHRTYPSNINPVGHLFSVAGHVSGANSWSPSPSSLQTRAGSGWVGEYSEWDVIIDQGGGVPNCEQINGQRLKRQITVSQDGTTRPKISGVGVTFIV